MSLTASRGMVNSVLVVPDGVPDSGPRERGFEIPCNFPQPSSFYKRLDESESLCVD